MDAQQGVTSNRPVVIQVAGATTTGDASEGKNENATIHHPQPQFVTLSTSGGGHQQVIISGNEGIETGHQIITSSHLVQGATVQEVQVMEGGQEVTYAYTSDNNTVTVIGDPSSVSGHHEIQLDPNSSSQAQQIFQVSNNAGSATTDRSQKASTPFTPTIPDDENVDESYKYYDNVRGKINNAVLTELVEKYDAENSSHSKNDRLHQWGLVTSDYCSLTGQNKSRTMLMKKWSSAKYYREHEGRPVELGGRVKGCFKKEKLESGAESPTKSISGNIKSGINDPSKPGLNKKDRAAILAKHMKQYDSIKLEAARFERDAQRINLENAVIEGEKLRKEAAILDIELDTIRIDLAIKKEQASKQGIIIQEVALEERNDKDANAIEGNKENQQTESQESVVNIVSNEESIQSPSKRLRNK